LQPPEVSQHGVVIHPAGHGLQKHTHDLTGGTKCRVYDDDREDERADRISQSPAGVVPNQAASDAHGDVLGEVSKSVCERCPDIQVFLLRAAAEEGLDPATAPTRTRGTARNVITGMSMAVIFMFVVVVVVVVVVTSTVTMIASPSACCLGIGMTMPVVLGRIDGRGTTAMRAGVGVPMLSFFLAVPVASTAGVGVPVIAMVARTPFV